MKEFILKVMYNLYMLKLIGSNRYIQRYIERLKKENEMEQIERMRELYGFEN